MATIPGGASDKFGNEFERLWTVRHLLEILAGRAGSIEIEPIGDDERGVEFWLSRPKSGTREAHQCKRENASHGAWPIADLAEKKILSNAKLQLTRDPSYRFIFASADKASMLSDFAERAKTYGEDANKFYQEAIPTSKEHAVQFGHLCRHLGWDPGTSADLAKIIDFLRRFSPVIDDKARQRLDLEFQAELLVDGDPKEVIKCLEALVLGSIGKILREPDITNALVAAHFKPRDLTKHLALGGDIAALRDRFKRSYRNFLIGGRTLRRPETDQLFKSLTTESAKRLILVHGAGGDGKSGVVFELTALLDEKSIPYLPLRFDTDRPAYTPNQYGKQLDLPGSPTACLAALADGRPAVLILDQIDAIRWTSAHSAHAWDTFEAIVTECLRHPNLRVVAVCRTFDVNDDKRIRGWKEREHAEELLIGQLDNATVDRVVSECGVVPSGLSDQQRHILRSPQALYLWRELFEAGEKPTFRTLTELMRSFWSMIRRKLKDLKPGAYEAVLDALVANMDRSGTVSAPIAVVSDWPAEVDALKSLNVLGSGDKTRIVFAHQSYLDHLTAEKVFREIHAGGKSISDWLRADDQSLFRRGQLRQVLTLLRDQDHARYSEALLDLLTSKDIRFHLQHLVLQLLGQANPPNDAEIDLVLGLMNDESMFDHVYGQVLFAREHWFDALNARGLIRQWLDGSDDRLINVAINLIERVIDRRCAAVELLLSEREGESWDRRIEGVLWRVEPALLTEGLFARLLRLVKRGSRAIDFVDWQKLASSPVPTRAILLLEARQEYFLRALGARLRRKRRSTKQRLEGPSKGEISALKTVATKNPEATWDLLMPVLLRIERHGRKARKIRRSVSFNMERYQLRKRLSKERQLLVKLLTCAGRQMARQSPAALWERIGRLPGSSPRSALRAAAYSIGAGPLEWADDALKWLVSDQRRFRCGAIHRHSGSRGGSYCPAVLLLLRFGPACSQATFESLERAILAHKPKWELDDFKYRHEVLMGKGGWGVAQKDFYNRRLFLGQYLLISALPKERLTTATRDWRGVLERKFGPPAGYLRDVKRQTGGFIGSTIPGDKLHLLSDDQWLALITGDWSSKEHRWKTMGKGVIGELKPETISRDLGSMAKRQPARFARLALRFPADVNPIYATALVNALAETTPPASDAEGWTPATVEATETAIAHFKGLVADREMAQAVCWVAKKRGSEAWGDQFIQTLVEIAMHHQHPSRGEYTVHHARRLGAPVDDEDADVITTGLNCARGAAAGSISTLLFYHLDKLELMRPSIESLIHDPHPAVRAEAIGIAVPLLNGDRLEAVNVFLAACGEKNEQILTSEHINEFLSYTVVRHFDSLRPLIDRMISSSVERAASRGAKWITESWIHGATRKEDVESLLNGSVAQRKGVAKSLVYNVARGTGGDVAASYLVRFFKDPDKEVRDAAANLFRQDDLFLTSPAALSLAKQFVTSAAAADNINDLLHGLDEFTGLLIPHADVIFAIVDQIAGPLAADARDIQTRRYSDAGDAAMLLLRLYEQSEGDRNLRRRCLDAWDKLLGQRIGTDILKRVDS